MSSLHNKIHTSDIPVHLSSAKIREELNNIKTGFIDFFCKLSYIERSPVKISSGIDKSVRFIGSHISVFKKDLLEHNIPNEGFVIVQPCIRTWNQKKLFDDNYFPFWGSYFPSLGVVKGPGETENVSIEIFDFFIKFLKIPMHDLQIRVNSSDKDFLHVCRQYFQEDQIEIDTFDYEYYRHKYGIKDIVGRNFNIAIRDVNKNQFVDIGNVISIDRSDENLGVEVALGATTILKELLRVDHVNDFLTIYGISGDERLKRKIEDSISVSVVLINEGLKPSSSSNAGRILRSYVNSLSYYRAKLGISMRELRLILRGFEVVEVVDNHNCTDLIIEYLIKYEKRLSNEDPISKEDKVIKKCLM